MNEKELANDENVDRKKKKEEKERNDRNEKYSLFISYYNHYGTIVNRAQNVSCYVLKLQLIVLSIKRNVRDIPKDVTQTENGARRKRTQNMEKKTKNRSWFTVK